MEQKIRAIFEKIKEYKRIIIFRHFRPDGDAIGSTKGLARIISLTFPEKEVYIQNNDSSDYLAFLGGETAPDKDELFSDALGIVIDTATRDRISSKKYELCRELVKIDHHIPVDSYGAVEWVEEERSSACEMIAAFYDVLKDEAKIDSEAATYIYCGMVTDSGRFRYREVSGETMRLAGVMLNVGIDTDTLFANLYLRDVASFRFEDYVHRKMKLTESGVAYIYVDKKMQKKFGLSREEASTSVSYMDSIKGSLIWIAFIESDDGVIRVRLRSRFITVNDIAENYHGGGHACASGATVYSKSEMKKLIADADAKLKEYKATNEGWL
jgi:phosphoesterase RecJ-like protein